MAIIINHNNGKFLLITLICLITVNQWLPTANAQQDLPPSTVPTGEDEANVLIPEDDSKTSEISPIDTADTDVTNDLDVTTVRKPERHHHHSRSNERRIRKYQRRIQRLQDRIDKMVNRSDDNYDSKNSLTKKVDRMERRLSRERKRIRTETGKIILNEYARALDSMRKILKRGRDDDHEKLHSEISEFTGKIKQLE